MMENRFKSIKKEYYVNKKNKVLKRILSLLKKMGKLDSVSLSLKMTAKELHELNGIIIKRAILNKDDNAFLQRAKPHVRDAQRLQKETRTVSHRKSRYKKVRRSKQLESLSSKEDFIMTSHADALAQTHTHNKQLVAA